MEGLAQPLPDPPDGRRTRFDQQLAVGVTADLAGEEVESLAGMDDRRLVLVEDQAPWRQPFGEPRLYLKVAAANGIDDFRNLVPGTRLRFPPLEK